MDTLSQAVKELVENIKKDLAKVKAERCASQKPLTGWWFGTGSPPEIYYGYGIYGMYGNDL